MVADLVSILASIFGIAIANFNYIVLIVIIWSVIWKGFALWKAAKLNQPIWFVVLLIVNTVGILEILYIFLFSEIKIKKKAKPATSKKKR